MLNIHFSKKVFSSIQRYCDNYLESHRKVYIDSGIWSHEKIIEIYVEESKTRYSEIVDTIESKLEDTTISYPKNQTIIRWRSKILLISFADQGNTRKITDLEIR